MPTDAQDRFSPHLPEHQRDADRRFFAELEVYYRGSLGGDVDKLRNFAKYVPFAEMGKFLARYEIFQRILGVHGSIVECGVFLGGGVMSWAKLSSILEPLNHVRRIVGFDSFAGFPAVDEKDQPRSGPSLASVGTYAAPALDDLREAIRLYDLYRPIGHIPRVELVQGDAVKTTAQYVADNPHLVVALLYLDFDIYEPTRAALEAFLPRMPRGAILAFDELGQRAWPGETLAVLEAVGLRKLRLERFPWQPQMSFAVLD
jgi:hypothetical protein